MATIMTLNTVYNRSSSLFVILLRCIYNQYVSIVSHTPSLTR